MLRFVGLVVVVFLVSFGLRFVVEWLLYVILLGLSLVVLGYIWCLVIAFLVDLVFVFGLLFCGWFVWWCFVLSVGCWLLLRL